MSKSPFDMFPSQSTELHLLRTLQRQAVEKDRLRMALIGLVEEKVDYMIRNNLGDPEEQHTIKQARAALKETE